jgi:hypothetical protein
MRPQKPCLGLPGYPCGVLTRNPKGRCRPCQQAHDRKRNRDRTQYQGDWQATSRKARKAQPWCTVCGTTEQLSLDHETGTVQCVPCNSSHRRNVDAR